MRGQPFPFHDTGEIMASKDESAVKMIPLNLFVLLSVFVFLAGAIGGILLCARLGHEGLTPTSGVAKDGRFAAQIEKLQKELAKNPDMVDSWTQLGNFYFDSDQYEKAIEAYRKSLSLEPNNPDVWTDLGIMYRSSGEPQKALEAFDRAITIDPRHGNSRFNKGIVLLHDLKDGDSAIKEWEELSRINPSYESDGEHIDEIILYHRMKQGGQNTNLEKE